MWGAVNFWVGLAVLTVTLPAAVFFATRVNRVAQWALDHVGRLLPKRFKSLAEDLGGADERTELTFEESARFSAAFAVAAVVSGLSFFVVLASLGDVSINDVPEAIGGYNLATMFAIALDGSKTPGELALTLEETTLITGDLVRAHEGGRLCMLPRPKLSDPEAAVASIQRLAALEAIETVLVGDGWSVFHGGARALAELAASVS